MKRIFKIVSFISMILYVIAWVLGKTMDENSFNNSDVRIVLLVVFLFTSLRYHQILIDEKDEIIDDLNSRLKKKD
ncbi:hypothetical protein [Robertkochia sediminum]|uniref:hypothetical protein n=1 Tax=Robertkochia sediminum TaxID=2785326 RepID=UPI00193412C3|nr:hypothetical protein [Robertkochia sediminum]MBL7474107.1 hypothetical protein [Robertkochia sediminum]